MISSPSRRRRSSSCSRRINSRQHHTFNMSAVRRSARLANRAPMPAMERAQRNLWRKLGVSDEEFAPIETILQEFVNIFQGTLPENIVAAMTALFNLQDDDTDLALVALMQHAGEGFGDMQGGPADAD
ncbi:hypothetical protein PVAP13_3NG157800 [Panicum virgatum]|uniref:Uncharacterized protein n=1 Tax=Panicum virgatum TaxID=38727 RepID=A0A8T0UGZ9_PANVG|nr:hypothetical protein PVAP13_3NG157800 [Panicum virgatum]